MNPCYLKPWNLETIHVNKVIALEQTSSSEMLQVGGKLGRFFGGNGEVFGGCDVVNLEMGFLEFGMTSLTKV